MTETEPPDLIPSLAIGIILPTLNERDNIVSLIGRLHDALGPEGWEAIIVDDNSADGTAELARRMGRCDPRIRVIERIGRRGLASAIIEGICATSAEYVVVMDADHQHDPAILIEMLDEVRLGQADIAVASRFIEGASADGLGSQNRERASEWANWIARRITGTDLTDPMSGYFLMETRRFRELVPSLSGIGFKILFDILAAAKPALKVKEFPLNFAQRLSGESKLDRAVAFEFLATLYERTFGQIIPTRFAMFGTVGALGVGVHFGVVALAYLLLGRSFAVAAIIATFAAMSFNFWLNNWLTYRDQRLSGAGPILRGWTGFCATCAVGAFANVAVASLLQGRGVHWALATLAGIIIGSVWNYALSSRFVWGRY